MLKSLRNYLSQRPTLFVILRKIIELNFRKQKSIMQEEFKDIAGKKILDIGCGTGEYARLFQSAEYTGIDTSQNYITYAKRKNPGIFLFMDATHLSFINKYFDIVFIAAILHHLDDGDVQKVLQEAKRVLKDDGKILIMEDAMVQSLDSFFIRLVRKYDLGAYIRTPEDYKEIYSQFFQILKEWQFRNGGCTYYAAFMEK